MKELRQGFTMIELMFAITIGIILMVSVIAPYNFYSDKSRVRLSAERVEQAVNKAKLLASTGYAPKWQNVDLLVHLQLGENSVLLQTIPSAGSGAQIPTLASPDRAMVEKVPLDSLISINGLYGNVPEVIDPNLTTVDLVFRAPFGNLEIWKDSTAPIRLTTAVSGGIVGVKQVKTGLLSRSFLFK